ncbi:MAG: penicillin acylase family protein, partial [Myxococcota bacterium]
YLIGAIDEARRIQSEDADGDDEARLLALYEENADAIDEAYDRLSAWLTRGAEAASGVQTFYSTPAGTDAEDAVATMIFNQWWREHIAAIFADEGLDFAFAADSRTTITRVIDRMWRSRGENTEGLASYDDASGESVFFDNVRTSSVVERSDEAAISALLRTFEKLSAAPSEPGVGGFGTADQSQWLWGLRHQVRFDSIIADFVGTGGVFGALAAGFSIGTAQLPLAEDIPDSDPRADLPWFPRPGDLFNVDAAHTSFSPDADYFYSNGPVMRMVIRLEAGNITGENILPGGQSGLNRSEHFADQAGLWLGNETVPMRFELADVLEGAVERETLTP